MSQTSRPRTHAQREQILRTLATYLASSAADPTVVELHGRFLAEVTTAYTTARAAHQAATGAWQAASAAAEAADEDFDAALRRLMLSFRDDQGRVDPALNASLLGGYQTHELIALRHDAEVTAARAFLARLAARSDLSPNPTRLADFEAATATLETTATAAALALGARLAAGTASETATEALDTAYGKFVRAVRAMVDSATAESLIARFNLTRGEASDAEAAGGAA